MISGSDRVALRSTCLARMRRVEVPITWADSTYGSALIRSVSARVTRKYCGTNTTLIARAAARIPPRKLDCPPEITIETTIASSSEGKA